MCEADAYFKSADKEEIIMSSVDIIEPEGDDVWRLVNIYGEQKKIHGRITAMNLVNHKILFEGSETT